jgi:hypothetical protein
VSAPEACEPLRRPCVAPLQPDDAGIRPLVLCAATAAERRRQPGVERTVVGDKARRLVLAGRAGRRARRPEPRGPPKPVYPEAIARSMLSVKPLSPSLHVRAIERMVPRPCGDKTNHHTRKRFLAPSAPPGHSHAIGPPWRPLPRPTKRAGSWSGGRSKGGTKRVSRTASSGRVPPSRRCWRRVSALGWQAWRTSARVRPSLPRIRGASPCAQRA